MNPRVFIPQVVRRFDTTHQQMTQMHDFSSAMVHGQLVNVLDDEDDPKFISRLVPKVKKILSDFTHEDYLVAVGDPTLIALCAGIIMRQTPNLTMLKWERSIRQYVKVQISL